MNTEAKEAGPFPLYVDLDGTLIATDLLWEAVCRLTLERPSELLRIPGWLVQGRARFKREMSHRIVLNPARLPYREEVLQRVRRVRRAGGRVVLATASDERWAEQIAQHLGLFDGVLASDGQTNLAGAAKLEAIERDGRGGFEYVGNSRADREIWRRARHAIVVAPPGKGDRVLGGVNSSSEMLEGGPGGVRAVLRGMRPHQWLKNILLFVPIVFAHAVGDVEKLSSTLLAFVCFCACASGIYLINDLFDLDADRSHPRKKKRPLASGALSIPAAIGWAVALLVAGLGSASLLVGVELGFMLGGYGLVTTGYSLLFKRLLFLDILVLAGLYVFRVMTGAVAAEVPVSPWLLVFSMFFFLSLAAIKRYTELLAASSRALDQLPRRGYEVADAGLIQSIGLSSGYLAVLVVGLYVSSDDVRRLYATPALLWLVCPLLLYWISRIWLLARRGDVSEDPVLFAVRDPVSYVVGALVVLCGGLATWIPE